MRDGTSITLWRGPNRGPPMYPVCGCAGVGSVATGDTQFITEQEGVLRSRATPGAMAIGHEHDSVPVLGPRRPPPPTRGARAAAIQHVWREG